MANTVTFGTYDPNDWTGSAWRADPQFASLVAQDKAQYQTAAIAAATTAGINPEVYVSLVTVESHWSPYALSPAGAIGLSQLMPGTASDLGVNAWDPVDNLKGGATYLAKLLKDYSGDYMQALAAYNAGKNTDGTPRAAGLSYAQQVLAGVPAGATQVATGATGATAPGSTGTAPSAISSPTANLLSDPSGWLKGIGGSLGPSLWFILGAAALIIVGVVMLKPKTTVTVAQNGR